MAARYGADPSASDWRRFGRLPGFTNCKPNYRQDNGLFPFVRLHSHSGQEFHCAQAFMEEITAAYEARERERQQRRAEMALSPRRGPRFLPSLERFRTSSKYTDLPAAADIAFCVAAYGCGMEEAAIEQALTDEYLSPKPKPFDTSCLHPAHHGQSTRLGGALAFGAVSPFASQPLGW